ncbi:Tip elongation aberrant protein-like protein [Hapsidospora chrysogenum ATCC 11550]|uniref:Tip elongation aberrant protein-like protein n=1 Tax=Hapsidospora chrysogenum (strain ATCC 11550 / CBS 779.69 / DSM 880 / IAM 14645 / JCM 23072 / IMI 49137) TaxID=857340 RepID=A0A086T398_HAPC1|nr:Tip elongation aberrant protein-like protein [Hapsidospora chrysogenum ATCC 11550]
MADSDRPADRSPVKTKVVRSQKIVPSDRPDDSDESIERNALPRSHTPGHLASKSGSQQQRRRVPSELPLRHRSQSTSYDSPRPSTANPSNPKPPPLSNGAGEDGDGDRLASYGRKPSAARSTSAIVGQHSSTPSGPSRTLTSATRPPRGQHTMFPPLQLPQDGADVPPAPASGMYWSRAPTSGAPVPCLRAHTTTLVGSNIYIFGGCDSRACFNDLYVLDADSFYWSRPHVVGDIPMPLRAMTCTAVGKKLVVFGGGDGPAYYNDIYVLDTVNFRWSRPRIVGDRAPSKRRAHTACLYKNGIYIFGGGDGVRALNDIWRLDVSDTTKMSWKLISSADKTASGAKDVRPRARGYHTANMVGSKLIIFGGSDGGECFDDVWIYDVERSIWRAVTTPVNFRRLSHTATIIGSYLFVVGGHDGNEYSNDLLQLNLTTMTWDRRKTYGRPPSGRGYHGAVLYDSRLVVIGGFDGSEVFRDVMILELAVHSYYSQISYFTIEV